MHSTSVTCSNKPSVAEAEDSNLSSEVVEAASEAGSSQEQPDFRDTSRILSVRSSTG